MLIMQGRKQLYKTRPCGFFFENWRLLILWGEGEKWGFFFAYLIILVKNQSYISNNKTKRTSIIFLHWQRQHTVWMDLGGKWLWRCKMSPLINKNVIFCCFHEMCVGSPQIAHRLSLVSCCELGLQSYNSCHCSHTGSASCKVLFSHFDRCLDVQTARAVYF